MALLLVLTFIGALWLMRISSDTTVLVLEKVPSAYPLLQNTQFEGCEKKFSRNMRLCPRNVITAAPQPFLAHHQSQFQDRLLPAQLLLHQYHYPIACSALL